MRSKRGFSLLELVLALGLLAILSIPVYQLFQSSVRYTDYSGVKIEASNFGQSITDIIDAGNATDLLANTDLTREYAVTRTADAAYRIESRATDRYHALVQMEEAGSSPYVVPILGDPTDLQPTQETHRLFIVEIQILLDTESVASYHVSLIE